MQHGMIGFSDAVPMIAAINAAGRPAIVRVLWNDAGHRRARRFDAGAAASSSRWSTRGPRPRPWCSAAKYPPMGAQELGRLYGTPGLRPRPCRLSARGQPHDPGLRHGRNAVKPSTTSKRSPRRRASTGCSSARTTCRFRLSKGERRSTRRGKDDACRHEQGGAAAKQQRPGGRRLRRQRRCDQGLSRRCGFTFIAAAVDVDLMQSGARGADEGSRDEDAARLTHAAFRDKVRHHGSASLPHSRR